MNRDELGLGIKIVLLLLLIFYLSTGVELLIFQKYLAGVFDIEIHDAELARFLGVAMLGISLLLGLGIKSDSLLVVKPIMQSLLLVNILVVLVSYWNYAASGMQPLDLYVNLGAASLFFTLMISVTLYLERD